MQSAKPLSVVIVALNEEKNIIETLNSLMEPSNRGEISEILVIDNGSTDQTVSLVQQFSQNVNEPKVRVLLAPKNNLGASRALGMEWAQSPLVAFIDADCQAPPYWAVKMKQGFRSQQKKISPLLLGGVSGPNRLPETNVSQAALNLMMDSFLGHGNSPQAQIPEAPKVVDHLPTTNAIFLKTAVMDAGNFSAQFPRVCEDVDLGARLNENGWTLFHLPHPIMVNESCVNLWQWARRMFKFGFGNSLKVSELGRKFHAPTKLSAFLVLSLAFFVLGGAMEPILWVFPLSYFSGVCLYSLVQVYKKQKPFILFPSLVFAYLYTHIFYGLGSLLGYSQLMMNIVIEYSSRMQKKFFAGSASPQPPALNKSNS